MNSKDESDSAGRSDVDLAAEIAPAMKQWLHSNAVIKAFGATIVGGSILLGLAEWLPIAFPQDYDVVVFGLMLAIVFISPPFARKAAISGEIKYRRNHGKWRWEH